MKNTIYEALTILCWVSSLVLVSSLSRQDPPAPSAPPALPEYAECREHPNAHTWAPEGKRIVHLICPVEAP